MVIMKVVSLVLKEIKQKLQFKNRRIFTINKDFDNNVLDFTARKEVKKRDYSVMQIFNLKGNAIFTMPLALKDYWLLKKYFLKNDVRVEDYYNS